MVFFIFGFLSFCFAGKCGYYFEQVLLGLEKLRISYLPEFPECRVCLFLCSCFISMCLILFFHLEMLFYTSSDLNIQAIFHAKDNRL